MNPYSLGAEKSPYDIRTFAYVPSGKVSGGARYLPEDIEDQSRVGICTAISLTQQACKATNIKYSADFQYLLQKKEIDKNWKEGSSISSALKVAKNFGLLPEFDFKKWITQADRNLPYSYYIKKLQAIPEEEIARLKLLASEHKIKAYASIPIDRDLLANAIEESDGGILTRFVVGEEWWTKPIEPLRKPKEVISGHAIIQSNYNGRSFRVANTWGTDWADKGTAYYLLNDYAPTEAWIVYYNETTPVIDYKLEQRKALMGQVIDLLQKLLTLLQK